MSFKIYYLDDEPALLEIFVDTFASDSIHVTTFTDPEKAIAEIELNPPDLLFLDFRLPNTTGVEFARRLDPSIPKALVTGDMSFKNDEVFVATFEKPTKTEAIEAFIRSHMEAPIRSLEANATRLIWK